MTMATVVPMTGTSEKIAVDTTLEFWEELGDKAADVVVKSDHLPAINHFVNDLIEDRGKERARTIPEESPVQSKESSGVVERAVQGIEGQMRALKPALKACGVTTRGTARGLLAPLGHWGVG